MSQSKRKLARIVWPTLQTMLLYAMLISSCLEALVPGVEYAEKKRASNISFEDTNWKIAAGCLSSNFGNPYLRNKDVRCASAQVVLSISQMQRVNCRNCESYFHCEGFLNAIKMCRDNYDVQDTLRVLSDCQGLVDGNKALVEAVREITRESNCQKYLCDNSCMFNPNDSTCLRGNCQSNDGYKQNLRKTYVRRPLSAAAFPVGSPLKVELASREQLKGQGESSLQGN